MYKGADSLQTPPGVGQVEGLEHVWEGGVPARHPLHGGLEVEEALALQPSNKQVNTAIKQQRIDKWTKMLK